MRIPVCFPASCRSGTSWTMASARSSPEPDYGASAATCSSELKEGEPGGQEHRLQARDGFHPGVLSGYTGPSAATSFSTVPLRRSWRKMLASPSRIDENATHRMSGCHSGYASQLGESVTRFGVFRRRSRPNGGVVGKRTVVGG